MDIKAEPPEPTADVNADGAGENKEPQPVPMETQDVPIKSEPVEADQPSEVETGDSETKAAEVTVKSELDLEPELKPEAEPGEESKPEVTEEQKPELDQSLDDNAVSNAAPSFVAPAKLVGPSIRINLMNPVESAKTLERRESIVSNSSDADSSVVMPDENSDLDPDCIIQPPKHENAGPKPKLVDRKLQEIPRKVKGQDISGLCSIM